MLDGVNNYPLSWPMTWARTPAYKRQVARFADRSIGKSAAFVLDELRMLGARDVVISTNQELRRDGMPKSTQRRLLEDPGAAVYFSLKGKPRVLACDKWSLLADNLWAIGLHIEAIRGQQRWGVGTVEMAFAGYEALPAGGPDWWQVLGVEHSTSFDFVRTVYRDLVKKNHPDQGGDQECFLRIQKAWEQACQEMGW